MRRRTTVVGDSGSDRGMLRSFDVALMSVCRAAGPVSLAARANVVTPLANFQTPALSGVFFAQFGAGRGSRIPTVSPPADFESAASTSSAIPARGAGRAARALPGGHKGGIIAESRGRAQRDAVRAAPESGPLPSRLPLDDRRPQRAVRDVRPVAARFRLLLRRLARADAEYRSARAAGRALRPRVRPVRRLRPVADVVLHRALRDLARRDVESRAAVRGRAHARRLSARRRDGRRRSPARRTCCRTTRRSRASASKSNRSAARCCAKAASPWSIATTATRRPGRSRDTRPGCASAATEATIRGAST